MTARRPPVPPWAQATLLGLIVMVVLAVAHRQVGFTRDEGVYFEAGRRYATWAARVIAHPAAAGDRRARDRAFAYNREHPALMKLAAGLSARLLARPPVNPEGPDDRGGLLPVMPESAAMRLPAQILAGVGAALLFFVARVRWGPAAGALAAGWFILAPRVFFHAGLATFDVPVAVATLAVALAYLRALAHPRWAPVAGALWGVAIAIKHNALFLGPLFALHYGACLLLAWRRGLRPTRAQLAPAPLLAGAALGPLVAFASWPWIWSDTWARLAAYVRFHAQHAWYNMEYLGTNYNLPPLPVSYPFVLTAATVSATLLVLAGVGLVLGVRRDLAPSTGAGPAAPPTWRAPLPAGWPRLPGVLVAGLALFPLALIAWPTVPIFGGTKHWLTAYPFLALAAAGAFHHLVRGLRPAARALALVLVLAPGLWATAAGHPFGLSQYAPLVGGPRGAATLGLGRGFWGHAVTPLLPELPARGRIYLHDLHELARKQYAREGRWPPALAPAPPARADAGLIFHELHMVTDEVRLWDALGTTRPDLVVPLFDVPLTSLYRHP